MCGNLGGRCPFFAFIRAHYHGKGVVGLMKWVGTWPQARPAELTWGGRGKHGPRGLENLKRLQILSRNAYVGPERKCHFATRLPFCAADPPPLAAVALLLLEKQAKMCPHNSCPSSRGGAEHLQAWVGPMGASGLAGPRRGWGAPPAWPGGSGPAGPSPRRAASAPSGRGTA